MNIGVVFPQTEFGSDPTAIREYAQTAEGLGYTHVVAYDHILGANPQRPGGYKGPYDYQSPFLEPFVLYSYMAAHTQRLGFVTGILILPQRQTALVAKQAATLDLLSGGRLRLGVGIGWNEVEYAALGQDFHTRGRRCEEQVALLRQLWTQPLITFAGRWDKIPDAGLNPLPIQQPIPIWFGGNAEAVLRRAARVGDGWMPPFPKASDAAPSLEKLDRYLQEAGRDRSEFGLEARISYGDGDQGAWDRLVTGWKTAGATHLALNTMRSGFEGPAAHLKAIREFANALDLQPV